MIRIMEMLQNTTNRETFNVVGMFSLEEVWEPLNISWDEQCNSNQRDDQYILI